MGREECPRQEPKYPSMPLRQHRGKYHHDNLSLVLRDMDNQPPRHSFLATSTNTGSSQYHKNKKMATAATSAIPGQKGRIPEWTSRSDDNRSRRTSVVDTTPTGRREALTMCTRCTRAVTISSSKVPNVSVPAVGAT